MSSVNITVPGVPGSTKKPGQYIAFNTATANRSLPGNTDRIVVIGQRLASGSTAAATLVPIADEASARLQFGAGSIIHLMVRAALNANPYLTLSAIALDDVGGAIAATAKITPSGNATALGAVTINIGNDSVTATVLAADTPAIIATAIAAAINARADLAVSAAAVAAECTLSAKNKGTLGNSIAYSATTTASGVTLTLTSATPGQLAGGSTDPVIAPVLTAIYTAAHTLLVTSLADSANLTTLRNHLTQVGGPMEQREATGIYGLTGTLSTATTLAATQNSEWLSGAWFRGTSSLPCEVAAGYAAMIAYEEDPASPINDFEIAALHIPVKSAWAQRAEQEIALNNGVTPIEVGPGDRARIVRAVTTYTVNTSNVRDETLLDITTMRTLGYVRRACRARVRTLGIKKVTPRGILKIRSALLVTLKDLEDLEIIRDVDENKPQLLVEEDLQNENFVNARIPAAVVAGLHVFAAVIDLL